MSWLHRLWNTFRPERVQSRIDRELSFHLAERTDQLRSEGLSDEEATRRARRQFGNVTVQAERTRDVDIALWADGLLRNVRYAVRTLTRTPGFTAAVVLTLALGIGANTAVFSAINAVLLQPLPFPDGDRLMRLRQTQERTRGNQHRACSSGRLASTELHVRGHHRPLDGERVRDLRRSAGESQACVRDGALPRRLGRCARPGTRLHGRRAPDRGTLCRLDQRSLLAPPVWRRPERGGERASASGTRRFRSSASCRPRSCFPTARSTCGFRPS